MNSLQQRRELAQFLRSRRAAVPPETAAGTRSRRRRTPGLRREEVADRAGVSVTWYTWLEQARDIRCSADLLKRLSGVLRLSASDTDYLFRMAGHAPPGRVKGELPELAHVQRVLDGFSAGPALLMNSRLDVLAFNSIAEVVFDPHAMTGPFADNQLWRAFMDPARRALYVDWELLVSQGVAILRANYATRVGDNAFESLIAELCAKSPEFRGLWDSRRTVALSSSILVPLRVPQVGVLNFESARFELADTRSHLAFFLSPVDHETALLVPKLSRHKAAAPRSADKEKA